MNKNNNGKIMVVFYRLMNNLEFFIELSIKEN